MREGAQMTNDHKTKGGKNDSSNYARLPCFSATAVVVVGAWSGLGGADGSLNEHKQLIKSPESSSATE